MDTRRIIVAEDDRTLAETLAYNLKIEGYEASIARTGLDALTLTRTQQPDLLLLDVMLPEMDGFEVCRTVRTTSSVPIIMLTARDDEVDRVLGLEMGADDYVVKPFSLRELLARIRAALRRVDMGSKTSELLEPIESQSLQVRPSSRSVYRDGEPLHLLPREFDLLVHLMRNHGLVLTREQLLEAVWGHDYSGDARTVDVHVRRLRMKVERDPSNPTIIRTVYGVGYTCDDAPRRTHDA
jgi:DNA-binding response OmpR family regulator